MSVRRGVRIVSGGNFLAVTELEIVLSVRRELLDKYLLASSAIPWSETYSLKDSTSSAGCCTEHVLGANESL